MRVLVQPHASEIGGSQLNAVDLAAAVRDIGHDVLITCEAGPLVERIRAKGLEHLVLPTGLRRPSSVAAAQIDRWVQHRGIDVVHGWEWPPAFDALWTNLRRSTAVVGSVMSMSVVPFYPKAIPLLVGTDQIRRAAITAGHRRVTLLEPPVDTTADAPGSDDGRFRAEHGLDPRLPLVAMVCRLVPELKREGLLAACDAIGALASHGRSVQLVIVGDGRCRAEVEERAQQANVLAGSRVVVLAGSMDDPRPAYAAADIIVGQGGSALRGMAFGKPLVVVGEDGFSDLLTPGTAARFLAEGWYGLGPGSLGSGVPALQAALEQLITRQGLRDEMGQFGRRLVMNRFSMARAADLLEEEYAHATDTAIPLWRRTTDSARAAGGMAAHKIRRRVQRWRGTERTDDANARPVRSPDGAKEGIAQ